MQANVYLIPIVLHEDETALQTIPAYIIDAVKKCTVLYAENERTARRFLKKNMLNEFENEYIKKNCTQIFIEKPYRNNPMVNDMLITLKPETQLCIAVDITATSESIKTKKIKDWRKEKTDLHKRPAIFLLY